MSRHVAPPFRSVSGILKLALWAGGDRWRRRAVSTLRAALDDLGPEGEPVVRVDTPHGRLSFHCPNELTLWRAHTLTTKEPETIAWIDGFSPGDVLWDVGANVGLYSLYAALRGAGAVLAFEPSAANYATLNHNIRLNGMDERITALALALSDRPGLGVLELGDASSGGALSNFRAGGCATSASPEYRQGMLAYGIDAFIRDFDPPFPNHVKIDVDGLEPDIVAGATATLADSRLRSVSVELDDARPDGRDAVIDAMARAGLRLAGRAHAPMFDVGPYAGVYNHHFTRSNDGEGR